MGIVLEEVLHTFVEVLNTIAVVKCALFSQHKIEVSYDSYLPLA